ncbi:MAG: stage II sporulation protein R [Oscillospiraceae bacterium]|nr:stage II sporulation protein R [Oscillospiraceae bacterium]
MNKRTNILTIAMLIGAGAAVVFSLFHSFSLECDDFGENMLRLHILPHSNSKDDQSLKYTLRDELLDITTTLFREAESLAQAKELALLNKTTLEDTANAILKNHNSPHSARVEIIDDMYFTTRKYEELTVPAGRYAAIRVIIGDGDGDNWWCVMFPPLCLPACTESHHEPFFSDTMSKQVEESTKIEVKFAVYEFFSELLT